MYAQRQLTALANRKALLQARITLRRLECVLHGRRIAAPIAMFDGLWLQWKQLPPWVKIVGVPVVLFAASKGKGKWATLLGVLPVVMQAWKGFREQCAAGARPDAMR